MPGSVCIGRVGLLILSFFSSPSHKLPLRSAVSRCPAGASPRIFDWGTGPGWGGGGADSGESKPPTPKFRFLFGFRPLYFENIGKCKSLSKNSENFL